MDQPDQAREYYERALNLSNRLGMNRLGVRKEMRLLQARILEIEHLLS